MFVGQSVCGKCGDRSVESSRPFEFNRSVGRSIGGEGAGHWRRIESRCVGPICQKGRSIDRSAASTATGQSSEVPWVSLVMRVRVPEPEIIQKSRLLMLLLWYLRNSVGSIIVVLIETVKIATLARTSRTGRGSGK